MAFISITISALIMVNVYVKTEYTKRVFVKLDIRHVDEVKKEMADYNFHLIEMLTPSLYIFKYEGTQLEKKYIEKVRTASNGKIQNIDIIVEHHIDLDDIQPQYTTESPGYSYKPPDMPKKKILHYGMGVGQAWRAGYNGAGVVVAVTDVGVDVNIPDLKHNIIHTLSRNFVDSNHDVYPERYRSYFEYMSLTDHGNRCAGLIAARKRNYICAPGIAYGSKIAVLKVATIKPPRLDISDDFLVEALSWHTQDIDIYSNSWQYSGSFIGLDPYQQETLSNGAQCGRNTKGSIFIFPAGPIAEGFSNSIYTIAVSSFNPKGGKPDFVETCASTLTSTYGEGTHTGHLYMKTTSYGNECTTSFKGTSASVAMVSAMVALALQANNDLTWRDIQHLIVEASHYDEHIEPFVLHKNAAGREFHKWFGFGLLNAHDLVRFAKRWTNVSPQKSLTARADTNHSFQQYKDHAVLKKMINVTCLDEPGCCVDKIEHVTAFISYKSSNETLLGISLESPRRTVSLLLQNGQSKMKIPAKRENIQFSSVNFWGENPTGKWTIILRQFKFDKDNHHSAFEISSFELIITGTSLNNSDYCQNEEPVIDCSSRYKANESATTFSNKNEEHVIVAVIGPIVTLTVSVFACFLFIVLYMFLKILIDSMFSAFIGSFNKQEKKEKDIVAVLQKPRKSIWPHFRRRKFNLGNYQET